MLTAFGRLCPDALVCHVSRDTGAGQLVWGACVLGLVRGSLFPDTCSCYVSRNASVSVSRRGLLCYLREHAHIFFELYGLAVLGRLSAETHVCCSVFGIVAFKFCNDLVGLALKVNLLYLHIDILVKISYI